MVLRIFVPQLWHVNKIISSIGKLICPVVSVISSREEVMGCVTDHLELLFSFFSVLWYDTVEFFEWNNIFLRLGSAFNKHAQQMQSAQEPKKQ